ncbi:TonB-dependent receptor domain-containing protein, partial [Xanthomonas euvesicatoria]|uniref:TonB-dependent receptor domain-containing protein n=1 Tax=Xanthomonas euvesicatoria TaxID=456327 RepID=UPI0013E0A25C
YYDRTDRENKGILKQQIDIFDIDFQHQLKTSDRNEVVWGAGYRLVSDDLNGSTFLSYRPAEADRNLFSAFLQNKYALIRDEVFLTLGSKFEQNDYTGFEVQPSARLSWLVDNTQSVWGSVSRAVRTPSRGEDGINALAGT